jgi:Flagellar biogenesis protein
MIFLAHSSLVANNGCMPCESFSCTMQLLGILFFLVAMAYVYRRLKASSSHFNKKGKLGRKLEILETKPLGNRQFLLVVAYEHEKFLVGVHPNGMHFLSKLKSAEDSFSSKQHHSKEPKPHH